MRNRRLIGFLMFLGLGLVALPATWVLAQGGDTIQACVRGEKLRRIGVGLTCTARETLLEWNVEGAQGPAGPQGPEGPVGPQGPQGLPGVLSFYRVVATGGSDNLGLVAVCNEGDVAVGGGFSIPQLPNGEVDVLASFPSSSGKSWGVSIAKSDNYVFDWSAYAVCADM